MGLEITTLYDNEFGVHSPEEAVEKIRELHASRKHALIEMHELFLDEVKRNIFITERYRIETDMDMIRLIGTIFFPYENAAVFHEEHNHLCAPVFVLLDKEMAHSYEKNFWKQQYLLEQIKKQEEDLGFWQKKLKKWFGI